MWKFHRAIIAAGLFLVSTSLTQAQDVAAGETVFKKCKACHAVGDGAKNKVGPQLNDLFGRTAGSIEGFKYSKAMVAKGEEGLVWDDESLAQYLSKPRSFIKGTRMAFAGLKKEEDIVNITAYLRTFSTAEDAAEAAPEVEETKAEVEQDKVPKQKEPKDAGKRSAGKFGLGRLATPMEIAAWDIDIRPDGKGLPNGRGTVAEGEPIYTENCAACHGDFGEAVDRWPVLAGGLDTLTDDRPVKTVGSYWPHLSTVFDYVRRAMPFGNSRSLTDDDVYALTAYILYLNDIVEDEDFELSSENFGDVVMPNAANFIPDAREAEAHYANKGDACMADCKPGPVEITMRARVLDVTPEGDGENDGVGNID